MSGTRGLALVSPRRGSCRRALRDRRRGRRLGAADERGTRLPGLARLLRPASPGQVVERAAEINAANPDRPFDYQKALNEMVHRYIVGALGLLVLALAALSVANRRDPVQPRMLPWVIVVLLVLQALLGMWTVTLLLKPLIVTLHLLGGLATLALLWWLALPPERRELKAAERPVRRLALAAMAVLLVQVSLGGWTSTNYAAAACADFPSLPRELVAGNGFRGMGSCCGAGSASTTKAACWTRPRGSRSITRTASALT